LVEDVDDEVLEEPSMTTSMALAPA